MVENIGTFENVDESTVRAILADLIQKNQISLADNLKDPQSLSKEEVLGIFSGLGMAGLA